MTKEEALRKSIEALELECGGRCNAEYNPCYLISVIKDCKQALEQPKQEPVAYERLHKVYGWIPLLQDRAHYEKMGDTVRALYTSPQHQPVPVPVAWILTSSDNSKGAVTTDYTNVDRAIELNNRGTTIKIEPLYTSPPEQSARIKELEADIDSLYRINTVTADILHKTANAIKGEPNTLEVHSWHDLADVAAVQSARIKELEAELAAAMTVIKSFVNAE